MSASSSTSSSSLSSSSTSSTPFKLVGLGYPLVDLVVRLDDETCDATLSTYNLKPDDSVLADPAHHSHLWARLRGGEHGPCEYLAGGATLNALRVAQWMLDAAAGAATLPPPSTAFVGRVGDDDFASILRHKMEEDRVVPLLQQSQPQQLLLSHPAHPSSSSSTAAVPPLAPADDPASGLGTGASAVLVMPPSRGGHRSLVAYLGSSRHLTLPFVTSDEAVRSAFATAPLLYTCGFMCQPAAPQHYDVALHAARLCPGRVAVNLSAVYVVRDYTDRVSSLVSYASFVFGNEEEARALARAMGWEAAAGEGTSPSDIGEIAMRIATLPAASDARFPASSSPTPTSRVVAITCGAQPTAVVVDSRTLFRVPVDPVQGVVDTTGAGDAFVGAFLAGHLLGRDAVTCARGGNWAAGKVIQQIGVRWDKGDVEGCPFFLSTAPVSE